MYPVYEAQIVDEVHGIYCISLVDYPAVESDFMAFNNDKEIKYRIQDDEQHILYGVLMRANFLIYREDPEMGQFYVKYTPETIKVMAEKLLADNRQNSVNIMHYIDSNIEGVNMQQMFIKDIKKGVNPEGFDNIEDGSLFAVFKVENEAVWEAVKAGTFKGFSLEGYFNLKPEKKKSKNKINMSKLKEKLKALLMEFASVATDKGEIFYEGELAIGVEVFDENDAPVADGEYATDEKIIVVYEGKVTEIRDKEEPAEEPVVEPVEEPVEAEEQPAEEPVEEPAEEPVEEASNEIDDLRAEIAEIRAELEELRAAIAAIAEEPAKETIVEEYENMSSASKTGNKKLDRLAEIMGK